jgi:DNA-binding response OmpR family regulator
VNDKVRILIVEDDKLIQAMIEEAVAGGGYSPLLTGSGEEAIGLLRDDKNAIRAVVTDINLLGRFGGWEVGRAAREIEPTMPIIYMTGTHAEEWSSKGVPNSVLVIKPFAPAQMVTAISQLLNAFPRGQSRE